MTTLECALAYLAHGISVIPIARDGQKRPASEYLPRVYSEAEQKEVPTWKPFQERLVTAEEASHFWDRENPPGIAALGGSASAGLELLDFDREADRLFPLWRKMVHESDPELLNRICVVRTPRLPAGYHVWLRCGEMDIPGNSKLAELSVAEKNAEKAQAKQEGRKAHTVLIETRGEGGYALVPGCPPECHENRTCYTHVAGPALHQIPYLSIDERDFLICCARSLTRDVPPVEPIPKSTSGNDLRPGDDFDRNGWDWKEILEPHGWTLAFGSAGGERRWRRPGKKAAWSATTGHCASNGADLLRVFSSSADPFDEGKCYGKFRAYALLQTKGDLKQAAQELRHLGFGSATSSSVTVQKKTPVANEPAQPTEAENQRQVATISDLARAGSEVSWLWDWWLPRGVLVALAAEGGTGKTRFCADLLRRIRYGIGWPDGTPINLPTDSKALWVVSDNHHDELVTLCRDFGIEDNVLINAWADDPFGGVCLEEREDFRELEIRIQKVKPVFVIVDTVGNATDRNLSKQEDARAFYQPLQVIARRYRTTPLCLTHLNAAGKFLGRRVMEKVRVAIRMEKPDPDDDRRALEVVKSNSKRPATLGLQMGDKGNEYDANPPKAPKPTDEPGAGAGRPATSIGPVSNWLRDRLAGGPERVSILRDEAESLGHSAGTLYRAKSTLGVVEAEVAGKKWWSIDVKAESSTPWG